MPANWGYISKLLEGADVNTPLIGTIWLFLLFGRIMLHGFAADDVFNDEKRFRCRTDVPDCTERCFDDAFPFSPVRLWTLQLICVALPALIYIGCVMHITNKEKKMREEKDKLKEQLKKAQAERNLKQQEKRLREQLANLSPPEHTSEEKLREKLRDMQDELELKEQLANLSKEIRKPRFTDEKGNVKIKGKLLFTYLITLLLKILVEGISIYIQYRLYGGQGESFLTTFAVGYRYRCNAKNDENHQCQALTQCFMPRPTEKTWTLRYMVALAGVSVLINVIDMLYLISKMRCCFRKYKRHKVCVEALITAEEARNTALMENMDNSIILEMENLKQRRSIPGCLDGDDLRAVTTTLTPLIKSPTLKTPKDPDPQRRNSYYC